MPSKPKYPEVAERDGTSQHGRALEALSPSYAEVDEQTAEQLLSFARAYGKELTYYGPDGKPNGDWSSFVSANLNPVSVAAFMEDPSKFDVETAPELYRPHFVLFLTFLKLLGKLREDLNGLTGRHLDFYYREILRMAGKASIPDRVNLVVNLAPSGREVLLPKAAKLNAGPDKSGRDRIYQTDRDLIVNRAQLALMKSLFVDQRRTTLREVPRRFPNEPDTAGLALFQIALGMPLPLYPDGTVVTYNKLKELRTYLLRAEAEFNLSLAEIRDVMTRYAARPAEPAEWDEINTKLEAAGNKKRGGGTSFTLSHSSRDFYNNVTLAVGTLSFGTLPQVTILDDLADLRTRADVITFIKTQVYFDNVDDFWRMIQLKRKFDNEWAAINHILEIGGQRQRADKTYKLTPTDVAAFATNVQSALAVDFPTLNAFWHGVQALEGYFFMDAERYAFALDEIQSLPEDDWDQSFFILEQAHREQLRRQRLAEFKAMREAAEPARLIDLIRVALGEAPSPSEDSTAFDRLLPFLGQTETDKLTQLSEEGKWDRIYTLLEVAQRARTGEPLAEMTEWLNLYPAQDATKVKPVRSSQPAEDTSRFAAFGVAQPSLIVEKEPEPVLGWAVSSPLLVLSEGTRTVTLTLGFRSTRTSLHDIFYQNDILSVLFEISTAKGFISCTSSTPVFGSYPTLCGGSNKNDPQGVQFVITLPATLDAIAAPPTDLVDAQSPWPVLRLLMRPIWSDVYEQHIARYPQLSELELLATHIKVEATGIRALQLQNDENTLEAKKPFEPFGSLPAIGSHFLIGHPEIVAKRLDSLTFNFQWMSAPDNLSTHYKFYGLAATTQWTTKISLVDGAQQTTLASAAGLFGATGPTPVSITIPQEPFTEARDVLPDPLAQSAKDLDSDLMNWARYVQWEANTPDFQHTEYQAVASTKALELAKASSTNPSEIVATDYLVRAPYTPKLKSISVGYAASIELRLDDLLRDTRVHHVLHIHPFGACSVETERSGLGVPFLPRYQNDGELYIALRNLAPPQSVSIFFQVAEGSADPDLIPQPVNWSYLDGDRWVPLDRHLVSDTTRSFSNSGLIELGLPAAQSSSRMRDPYYWIRATLARDTLSVCDIVGVYTQGVSATFVDRGNSPEHFRDPLPAGTLTQLVHRIPQIAGVKQPYTSFGGRMAESSTLFTTRVSERLRHKNRALTIWDYERLVLDKFPELHKVKCIPATPEEPGKVRMIVIPDIRNKIPFEPFAPKAPADLLSDVRDYLRTHTPACSDLEVSNAHYVAVRVRLGVRFRGNGNDEYYKQQLMDDLNHFLSPWAYDEGSDIAIGGRIYASSIVDFVDRRPYIDYVAGIKLHRSDDGYSFRPVNRPPDGSAEGYYVGTEKPHEVLVAARAHLIDVLADAAYEEKLVTGIDFMKLEFDFIVAEG